MVIHLLHLVSLHPYQTLHILSPATPPEKPQALVVVGSVLEDDRVKAVIQVVKSPPQTSITSPHNCLLPLNPKMQAVSQAHPLSQHYPTLPIRPKTCTKSLPNHDYYTTSLFRPTRSPWGQDHRDRLFQTVMDLNQP